MEIWIWIGLSRFPFDDGSTRPRNRYVSFWRRGRCPFIPDKYTCFRPIFDCEHGRALGQNPADGLSEDVAGRVEILPEETAVEAQGLAPWSGWIERKAPEFDPPGYEALHVEDVQAFVEPVHEERVGSVAVGADLARIPLLDRSRIRHEGEDPEGDLGEGLGQSLAPTDHAPGCPGGDIAERRRG